MHRFFDPNVGSIWSGPLHVPIWQSQPWDSEVLEDSLRTREFAIGIEATDARPVTIEPLPNSTNYSLSPANSTVTEGNRSISFTITRSGDKPQESIYASTLFDSAKSPGDYVGLVNLLVSFKAGDTSKTFTLQVNDDTVVEATEHFRVMIGRKTTDQAAQALDISDIYIEDDDGPPATNYVLTPSSTTKTEGNTTITFTVTRSGGTMKGETIYASTLFDTAHSPGDYDGLVNKTIVFTDGEATETFTVHINDDSEVELTEHFRVMIAHKTSDQSAQALDISDIYIEDNDALPPNKAPVVTGPSTVNLTTGQTVAASTLFGSAIDPDGTINKIRFWDATHETGYFLYDGQKVTAGYVDVTPALLSKLSYVAGTNAGKNDIVIEAFDNLGLDSNDLQVRINIAKVPPPQATVDDVREGTDTSRALVIGEAKSGTIDSEPISGDGVTPDQQGGFVDKDWYRVTLSRDHLYAFSGASLSIGTGQVAISLYAANGSKVHNAVEGASPSFTFDTGGQSASSQTYYLAVSAGGASPAWLTATGDYVVAYIDNGVSVPVPDDWADDPNDTGSPGSIARGGSQLGAVERIGDYDYFSVYLYAENTYHFSVAGETRAGAGKIDTVALSLRSAADFDTRLRSDGGLGAAGFDYDIKQSGTYYVRVGAGSDASDTGGYRVSVSGGKATPVPAPSPPPPAGQTPLQELSYYLDAAWSAGLRASLSLFSQDEFWASLRIILKKIGHADALGASNIVANKIGILATVTDFSLHFNEIDKKISQGYDPSETIIVEMGDFLAGEVVVAVARASIPIGFAVGGVFGGIITTLVGFGGGSFLYNKFGSTFVRDKIDLWYDGVDDYSILFATDKLRDESPLLPQFDEAFYRSAYPDVELQIDQGLIGSAYAHFLTVGIDLGYQPNGAQTVRRDELAVTLGTGDPQMFGSSVLFTQSLGNLAGDGISADEGAVAMAFVGAVRGASLDADLSAVAHRKALDLAVNTAFDAVTAANANNSDWALSWSDGADFRQAFAGNLEALLGANAPDSAYRVFVISSPTGTPADVLIKLQAQQGWATGAFDTFGIAEYAGLWVVIVADRVNGVGVVAPGDDGLATATVYGTAADEALYAGLRSGRLFGLSGADRLFGGAKDDLLVGGGDDDVIYGGLGNDIIEGGAGQDQFYGQGGADTFVYAAAADSLFATYDVILDFEAGTDKLDLRALYAPTLLLASRVFGTSTFLFADVEGDGTWEFALLLSNARISGDDVILPAELGPIGLTMYGSDEDDAISAGAGNDVVLGGAGGDAIFGGEGADLLMGEAGDDRLRGGDGHDSIWAGDGDDWLEGGAGDDTIDGGEGIDTVSYADASGAVRVDLGWLEDQNTGSAGRDTLLAVENVVGSGFADVLSGSGGGNLIDGGDGDDVLSGRDGHDSLWGGAGNDVLDGGEGNDTIDGGAGNDTVSYAGALHSVEIDLSIVEDQLTRGAGVDTLVSIENLIGSEFDDVLAGNAGTNVLMGGGGNDRFVFSESSVAGRDRIADFSKGDLLDLSAIDANGSAAGDAAFTFIGTATFSGGAGQLRVAGGGGIWTVEADLDGDSVADFLIDVTLLVPGPGLVATDFIL